MFRFVPLLLLLVSCWTSTTTIKCNPLKRPPILSAQLAGMRHASYVHNIVNDDNGPQVRVHEIANQGNNNAKGDGISINCINNRCTQTGITKTTVKWWPADFSSLTNWWRS